METSSINNIAKTFLLLFVLVPLGFLAKQIYDNSLGYLDDSEPRSNKVVIDESMFDELGINKFQILEVRLYSTNKFGWMSLTHREFKKEPFTLLMEDPGVCKFVGKKAKHLKISSYRDALEYNYDAEPKVRYPKKEFDACLIDTFKALLTEVAAAKTAPSSWAKG